MKIKNIMPVVTGLGDVVHAVARPVAAVVDAVAGTNLQNCGGCAARRQKLNQKYPMKRTLIALFISIVLSSHAAIDWTYSTNLYYSLNTITNVYMGTNSADPVKDTYIIAFNKLNHNDTWLQAQITALATNPPSIRFTNTVTGAPGTSVVVTNYGGLIGVFQITIPAGSNGAAGAPGTNYVTVNQFTNVVLSSQRLVTYSTNNITWSTSNFLARVNGYYDNDLYGGQLGGSGLAPGTNVFIKLVGSLTGTNAWFTITNGYYTTNQISIAAVGAGGGLGTAKLYTVDHFELLGRTNYFFGQHIRFDDPLDGNDAATKSYTDVAIANALDGHWVGGNLGNIYHLTYGHGNGTALDIGSSVLWASNVTATVDGTGTNVAIIFPTNSLTSWRVVSSTNLTLANGFTTYTNWTASTNTGIVTVLAPINFNEDMRFYSIQGPGSDTFTVNPPIIALGGTIYPSNTWSLATITNAMSNLSFWTGNSNGTALATVHLSNGVVRVKLVLP